jgi:light-regulated signal transduction histidine kinase (bacteriophytochrome)
MLFALDAPDLRIAAVSANVADHLGRDPATLLGMPVAGLLDAASLQAVAGAVARDGVQVRLTRVRLLDAADLWRAVVRPLPGGTLLEVMLRQPQPEPAGTDLFDRFEGATRRLQSAADTVTICARLAEEIQDLTGYERVMVYRFARDWSGEVVAESNGGNLPSYLGLHFPPSDIPAQARALYVLNPVRQIPDVGYTPVPLVANGPRPVDLSQAMLRSVSPIHIEYLRNMGVGAAMSVSILRDGALWGLVACHHRTAYQVAPELCQACVLLADLGAWKLAIAEEADIARRSAGVTAIETKLLQETAAGRNYREALLRNSNELLELLQASGLAFSGGGSVTTLGETPPEDELRDLLAWLSDRGPDVFETDHLAAHYRTPEGVAEVAGILAVPLGGAAQHLLVWFRPEIARTVTWGGDPAKPVEPTAGQNRLNPRLSFEAWTEEVRGRSRPWERHEVAAANALRDVIVDLVLRRSLDLEQMNAQLVRSNDELEAFAYVASHDLKEPLRQIETFGTMLERAFRGRTPADDSSARWFEGIRASSRRLRVLIDDLAGYSRLGRKAKPYAPTSLGMLLDSVKSDLESVIETTGATIEADALPVIMCDGLQLRQVMQNIVANSLKYRHPDRVPRIRISAIMHPAPFGAVSYHLPVLELQFADNGIGFEERHRERIFEPFQRLHSHDDYEGSGIGLAICRKIVSRHGGSITAIGRPGEGAVFTIMLPLRPLAQPQGEQT